jgi:XTP/dITP diphosphohydrolase
MRPQPAPEARDRDVSIVTRRLLLATHNEHKRREFVRLFADGGGGESWEIEALPNAVVLPPEDGLTFAENALGKARAAAQATGSTSIADDSGIGAAALGGAPGVRSARFAGESATDAENLEKLIREAPAGSGLEYVCVIAYVDPSGGLERVFEGRCAGRMAAKPRGEGGFGYDPVFVPDDHPAAYGGAPADEAPGGPTMAELSDEQKDAISHRGRATRALTAWLMASPTEG